MDTIIEAFTRAADKSCEPSALDLLEAILRERPDLRNEPVVFPEQGMLGYTIFIGNEVFKGPRYAVTLEAFDRECEILQQLGGKGLPVPEVTCVGKETVFYGMTRVPGVQLGVGFQDRLTLDEQRDLARDVVSFIIGLALALPRTEGKYAVDADVNEGNVLIDPKTNKLSGIIDFGMIGCAAKDEIPSYSFFGPDDAPFRDMLQQEFDRRAAELQEPRVKAAASPGLKLKK